jgi:hypothetical protein
MKQVMMMETRWFYEPCTNDSETGHIDHDGRRHTVDSYGNFTYLLQPSLFAAADRIDCTGQYIRERITAYSDLPTMDKQG